MHRPGSDRGEDDHRGDPGGPGRGTGDAGTARRLPGEGDRSDFPGPGDGDGGPRTRTAGAVPSPRNSGGRTSQQHLVGQPGITANSIQLVIAYVSKSLDGSEQRYCTARKELLAVVRALKHFKCYLYGQKITVRTDNSAVSWLHRSKDPVGQPARWIEVIDTYDITFQHRPGRKHGNADALSRYLCRQCGGDCETPVKAVRAVTRSQECEPGWTPEEMAARQDADPDIGPIMTWKRVGQPRPGTVGRTTQPFVSAKIGSRPRNKMESGTAAAPARDGGKDDSTIRLG